MMEFSCEEICFDLEFQFALEMVILNRHEEGATLPEIYDDFEKHFGIRFETIWGYNCLGPLRAMLSNIMINVSSVTLEKGCIVYHMNIDAAIQKLSYNLTDNMAYVVGELDISLDKLKEMRYGKKRLHQSSWISNSDSIKSYFPKSTSSLISAEQEEFGEFFGHSIIADDFFLDLVYYELNSRKYSRKRVRQIGQCISGQTIRKATKIIPRIANELTESVIVNLGSIDLLQGRELLDMMNDMYLFNEKLSKRNIFPILTTIPPLGNQMHNKELERKRKAFNGFLSQQFDCIDIEHCFLTSVGQVIFDLYHLEPRLVSGTQRAIVPWNRAGLQRVLKTMKKKIPDIYNEDYQ